MRSRFAEAIDAVSRRRRKSPTVLISTRHGSVTSRLAATQPGAPSDRSPGALGVEVSELARLAEEIEKTSSLV
jgi:hypothetical protein